MRSNFIGLGFVGLLLSSSAVFAGAKDTAVPKAVHDDAVAILRDAISVKTVIGNGQVPVMAQHLKDKLVKGGFDAKDIEIVPVGETAALVAHYRGTGKKKPILLSVHMDVVEAKREDWTRDPFTLVEENGYFYGRGVYDVKFDMSMIVATFLRLKAEGFKPNRDLVIAFSGDEETTMASTRVLAKKFPDAEFLLNGDAGGGTLNDKGEAVIYNLQAAEKTYADFDLTVTNPGGHSSRPTRDNAIVRLSAALTRLGSYEFPVVQSELTKAYFTVLGKQTTGKLGEAMRRYAENRNDAEAIKLLSNEPEYVGSLRTTCVATMVNAGHAQNALPQRASANVNCRIFPGVPVATVKAELEKIVADPEVKVTVLDDPTVSDASPLRDDVMKAVEKAVHARHPGLPIIPQMSPGATDSMHFRNAGIPSYGVSGVYINPNDDFSHGLNERMPVTAVDESLSHWYILLKTLSR